MTNYALHLTRDQINDAANNGGVAVVPTGSLEQHGTHLPVGTDSLLAEHVSRKAVKDATELGTPAVAFPALWTGFSPHHVPFGGTVSLRKETLLSLLDDVCNSLIDIGFPSILLVNGHGGNRPAISLSAGDIGTRQDQTDVAELSYIHLATDVVDDARAGDPGSAYHAGEVETSLMLYLYEELVDMDEATDQPVEPITKYSSRDMFRGGALGMRRTYDRLTETGVRGEATKGTAETGEILFNEVRSRLTDVITELAELD